MVRLLLNLKLFWSIHFKIFKCYVCKLSKTYLISFEMLFSYISVHCLIHITSMEWIIPSFVCQVDLFMFKIWGWDSDVYGFFMGGGVASWLVHSSLEWVVWV